MPQKAQGTKRAMRTIADHRSVDGATKREVKPRAIAMQTREEHVWIVSSAHVVSVWPSVRLLSIILHVPLLSWVAKRTAGLQHPTLQ